MLSRLVSSLPMEILMLVSKLGGQLVTEPKAPKTEGLDLNPSSAT